MPRPRNAVPSYRLHKQSGQAVITIRTSDGTRRDVLLGEYGSAESKAEYERVLAQLRLSPQSFRSGPGKPAPDISINELLVQFFEFAEQHYRDATGKPTGETANYKDTVRPLVRLYGKTPAIEFGPLALKAVREEMVRSKLSRRVVNNRVNRIRRIFKWAAGEELIPFEAYHRLTTVSGLAKG